MESIQNNVLEKLDTQKSSVTKMQEKDKFQRFLELTTSIVVKNPKVEGAENLSDLDSTSVIFATSHLSDTDPTIAARVLSSLGRDFDIASLATNQKAFAPILNFVGRGRFHDVANTFDNEKNMPHTSFDSQNYVQMSEAMKNGKDMVIAAHKPSRDWRLPDTAGVGDVYLSHLTESPIIPIAVDIHSEKPAGMSDAWVVSVRRALAGKRPEVTVRIGKPIKFESMQRQDLEDVGMILMSKRDELRNDGVRYERALGNYNKLREQSETVLNVIAEMLPSEKRGRSV